MALDPRAVKILEDTYWSKAGWRRDRFTAPADLEYALRHKVMFAENRPIRHDEAIQNVVEARSNISQSKVVDAFLASLSTRRLELRSSLGSFAVARNMRAHEFRQYPGHKFCAICGLYPVEQADFNILNFERIKWGGVRHNNPQYISLDLEKTNVELDISPNDDDKKILILILEAAKTIGKDGKLNDLSNSIARIFRSNAQERRSLISILGFAGILADPAMPTFREVYVPYDMRTRPPGKGSDWPYTVEWWNGSLGVNEAAVKDWFPGLADEPHA